MGTDDVVAIAEAVYAVPAAQFVAERTRRATEARQTGNRDLAARVAALPKPSASAALANRLAHEAGDDLLRVLRLGAALREAQRAGDRQRLRTLTADRRRLLDEVAGAAADRAELDGRRPGPAVLEELQQTLQAAMASDRAAAAVRSGRLVRALSADGLEPADLHGAVAPEGSLPDPEPLPVALDATDGEDGGDGSRGRVRSSTAEAEVARRRRRAEAEQRAHEGREAAEESERAAAAAREDSDRRAAAADEARQRVDSLRSRLRTAEAEASDAERAAEAAHKAASRSAEAAERARTRADAAEQRLAQQS